MKRILFVDDDPYVLQGMRRMLHSMRGEWEMRFASSGAEALEFLAASPADAVVSDMRMPNMNGAELLNQVKQLHPQAVRFILSGYADVELIMQCIEGTHQFLSKPCDAETLKSSVSRALEMGQWLSNGQLKALVSRLTSVPSLPSLYYKILKELNSPEASVERAGATIAQDPAMTAKILQLINSAFFGLSRKATDPTEAVIQLGLETIKSLVLSIHVFSHFESRPDAILAMEHLHRHSLQTAMTARKIAHFAGHDGRVATESFTAGLLHDIGSLVLLANLPSRCANAIDQATAKAIPMIEAERAVFGVSHAEVGGYLLGLWGLPLPIVESVLFHHCPYNCQSGKFSSLTAVHIANQIEQEQNNSLALLLPNLNRDYLTRIGIWEQIPKWWEALKQKESE